MFKVFINRCFHASTATLLNIGGLIIGITAFILILQEVYYEYSFDRFHPYSERTFRVEMDAGDGGYSTTGLRWPEAQQLDSLSPHIKVAFLIAGGGLKNNIVYSDERAGRHLFAG